MSPGLRVKAGLVHVVVNDKHANGNTVHGKIQYRYVLLRHVLHVLAALLLSISYACLIQGSAETKN